MMRLRYWMCAAVCAAVCGPLARASEYDAKPKLVVVLVLDQFRGDYLDRFRGDFHTANGFNLFLKRGAYFPNAYYEYANTETAPGHSTIGTCAYSNGHNLGVNDWWDLSRSTTHMVSNVEDENYPLVGTTSGAELGASPRNEEASTLGDEVVLASGGHAKLFGVSLKDRAAILTSGHASQGAYWIDHQTGHWITSTYWRGDLPAWVKAFNAGPEIEQARRAAGVDDAASFYEKVGLSPASVHYEMEFAKALISNEQLGKDQVTDVITISISSTDILGHEVGPDDPRQHAMIDAIDTELDSFFTWLDANVEGGLGNVWVSLTGDHGVAPNAVFAAKLGMPASSFNYAGVVKALNEALAKKFHAAASEQFVLGGEMPYMQLNDRVFEQAGVHDERVAEEAAAALLPAALDDTQAALLNAKPDSHALRPSVIHRVYTKSQLADGRVPNTEEGKLVLNSYWTGGGWWLLVEPGMYQMAGRMTGTTHFSINSYDRHVPVAFFGAPFVPGTYLDHAEPVDISATFAALLRVNRPSACVGRVVTEALRPIPAGQ